MALLSILRNYTRFTHYSHLVPCGLWTLQSTNTLFKKSLPWLWIFFVILIELAFVLGIWTCPSSILVRVHYAIRLHGIIISIAIRLTMAVAVNFVVVIVLTTHSICLCFLLYMCSLQNVVVLFEKRQTEKAQKNKRTLVLYWIWWFK